jgi:hypothetical protein
MLDFGKETMSEAPKKSVNQFNFFELINKYSHPKVYENFLSISFAYCLTSDDIFRKSFLELIDEEDDGHWKIHVQKRIEVGTRNKYPDILFEHATRKPIIIEVKHDAGINFSLEEKSGKEDSDNEYKSQLEFYRRWLGKDGKLFLLAKNYVDETIKEVAESKTEILYWHHLGKLQGIFNEFTVQFLSFLKRRGFLLKAIPLESKQVIETIIGFANLRRTLLYYLEYLNAEISKNKKWKCKIDRSPRRGGPNINYQEYFYKNTFKITQNGASLTCTPGIYFTEADGIVPCLWIYQKGTSKKIFKSIPKKYKQGEDFDYWDKSIPEIYFDFNPEGDIEEQKLNFRKSFLDEIKYLLTLKKR